MSEVIVIGGGAAGLMAAVSAAEKGASVTLLERNEKLGKKIYITGKGRCNVTNQCDADTFRRHVVKNARFLYSALDSFSPADLMEWLQSHGCPVETERGDRVFPASQKASDVTRTFERELRRLGVRIILNTRVSSLLVTDGACTGVRLESGQISKADAVIVCTGGCSYPSTGSTGDGWRFFEACGHTAYPPLPSLTGLKSNAEWVRSLQGLSLKNVALILSFGKKKLFSEIGEMLFTHFGISGPLALSASAYMAELPPEDAVLTLNLKPGLNAEQLDSRILRDITASPKKQLSNLLCGLYPARLAEAMATICHIDGTKLAGELTKEERSCLLANTLSLRIPVIGLCGLDEAIITRGGICVREINPSTMESRIVKGLYAAGELLDVDALTGGFNLHIAFSTGRLAGLHAGNP